MAALLLRTRPAATITVAALHKPAEVRGMIHSAAGGASSRLAKAVLLDLDGTLLDTAPDLIGSLNDLRREHGLTTLAPEPLRPIVAQGGAAMIRHGFALSRDEPGFASLLQRYLDIYRARLSCQTRPFPGIDELLAEIEARNLRWGIVTNKPSWLTRPLLKQLGYLRRAACVVTGDCRALHKPNPHPIFTACRQLALTPPECVMVGDAPQDIAAARRAGTPALAALFGYLEPNAQVADWGADGLIEHPLEILSWLAPALGPSSQSSPPGIQTTL
ncbi:phosphoglycolate phosphatase [Nitrococcus mobilis Nb-231]|uniref:Phosphoglycolate phosphatase n=2 Tax=Nitrococcus mobilis TaxID=35797 RepID=A4BM41_9GAMM|nr:phosphoglycolate phosphatase [Nitrococcus mobilis Nb-231]